MHLGILNTDALKPEFVARYGEYPDMFQRSLRKVDSGLRFSSYDVRHGHYPQHIDEVDAYLITGSKSSVYDDEPWIHASIEFVRALHDQKKPVIGICFGHQLIAHALGGETAKAEQGWQVGIKENRLNDAARKAGIDSDSFRLISSHQDQVIQPASGAEILASNAQCQAAMTRLGDHIITVQGHPEFEKAFARELLDMRREILGEPIYSEAIASLANTADNERVLRWCIEFVRRAVEDAKT